MQRKAWAFAVLLSTVPVMPLGAGIYYSPVFNMPLQPAPSAFDGGFYTVMPNGVVYGPNYYLVPPFNPTSGFNTAFVGQRIFGKLFEEAVCGTGKDGSAGKGGPGGGPPPGGGGPGGPGGPPPGGGAPPPRQIGGGGYKLDYSDPETWKNFDATAPMLNGYTPFANNPQPRPQYYGNGPMPLPHYANYPSYQYPTYQPPPPPYGYGYRPCGMISQGPSVGPSGGVYQAGYYAPGYYGYAPGYYGQGYYGQGGGNSYYGAGYYGTGYYGGPIRQVQSAEPYCPPQQPYPYPQGGAYGPSPYNQGCMPPARVSLPSPSMPYVAMPTNPNNPNYCMPQTCFPTLPNPSYEPPPCQENPNLPRYFTNSVSHSPRDFFMWKEVEEDKARRARLPLTVPQ